MRYTDRDYMAIYYHDLTEDDVRKHHDNLDWKLFCSCHGPLSEDFIREFKDKVDWESVSIQPLSEDFIREFKDKVDWVSISLFQKLSEDFIREFKDKVNKKIIYNRYKIRL